jgi:uncharacterized membrane protein YfcA
MLILVGFAIAFLIGLTGVGAGTMTAPILILFLGLPPGVAVGTALLFGTLVKLPAASIYLWNRQVDFRTMRLMLAGGLPGVMIGTLLFQGLRHRGNAVLFLVGAIVILSAFANLVSTLRRMRGVERPRLIPPATLLIGMEVGFSSAGAGALGTLLLFHTTNLTPAKVVGTDLLFGLLLAAAGGGLRAWLGQVSPEVLLPMLAGGMLGSTLGAYAVTLVPRRPLKVGLLLWLLFIGTQLLYRGAGHG